jgi:hypothetical protein
VDPNALLKALRDAASKLTDGDCDLPPDAYMEELLGVAEHMARTLIEFDAWMLKGGYLPADWAKARAERRTRESSSPGSAMETDWDELLNGLPDDAADPDRW